MPDQREATAAAQVIAMDHRGRSNECARVTVRFGMVLFLTSCSLLTPESESVPDSQPVWPVEDEIIRNDQVILLPKADGSVGALVVRQEGVEIVLDKAYASAVIEGPGQVRQLIRDPGVVKETFAATLEASPPRPASFMLYFVQGKEELTVESKKEVEKMLAELAKRPAAEISVIGHTDTAGSDQFNDKLSLQRAAKVRQLLMARGIPPDSISIAGRGERELLIPTQDNVHEPRNRRVEIGVR